MAHDLLDEALLLAQERGFVGSGDVAEHRRHAAAFLPLLPDEGRLADLGTGGGLPGLVLAWERPALQWLFVESSSTRARWLEGIVSDLDLAGRVEVLAERAETVGRSSWRGRLDGVTARSFGPPGVVAECAAPLLRPGGVLVVSEPPEGAPGDRWPAGPLAELGFGPAELAHEAPRLVRVPFVGPCPDRVPRKVGQPAKRPLF